MWRKRAEGKEGINGRELLANYKKYLTNLIAALSNGWNTDETKLNENAGIIKTIEEFGAFGSHQKECIEL